MEMMGNEKSRGTSGASALGAGLRPGGLALPNLFLRSAATLILLYGLLGLILVALVESQVVRLGVAIVLGVAIAVFQYLFGPWILDLILSVAYRSERVTPERLPTHLRAFVERVTRAEGMKFPRFRLIRDGAPQAFTYGHHPNNARIAISTGLLEILSPEEVEAVIGHEIGHARHWDMVLMSLASLVPLLLYYLYRVSIRLSRSRGRGKAPATVVAVAAYVLYIIAQYLVLWFSRTREYHADRFAGRVTGNPNALASALVKIAYGLSAQAGQAAAQPKAEQEAAGKLEPAGVGPLGAFNIFDRSAALSLVMCSAGATVAGGGTSPGGSGGVSLERVKGAMQWDLWNPWAAWYELHSTHPLVGKRLQNLGAQAAAMGQEPYVVFDRKKPESYWDEFVVDLLVIFLPALGLLGGLGIFLARGLSWGSWERWWLGVAVSLLGAGMLVKTWFRYRRGAFSELTLAALVSHVKVSPVRPVLATLTGTIIGRGVPGLIFSEDFVLRDQTGIIFLDYRQPFALWNFLFGLLRAGQYQGRAVRARGWFRRAPVPYLELDTIETLDGSLPPRRCYTSWAKYAVGAMFFLCGLALALWWAK